jgi:hypothetical protein
MSDVQFERWMRYVREAEKSNVDGLRFDIPIIGKIPTVTMTRDALLDIRVELMTLRTVACALLELDPETASVGTVLRAMAERECGKETP